MVGAIGRRDEEHLGYGVSLGQRHISDPEIPSPKSERGLGVSLPLRPPGRTMNTRHLSIAPVPTIRSRVPSGFERILTECVIVVICSVDTPTQYFVY